MKYLYLETATDRVVVISSKPLVEQQKIFDEYIVPDDFDLKKEFPDEHRPGKTVMLEGFLTATEFLQRFEASYVAKRVTEYPGLSDQIDMLWHAMDADPAKRLEPFYSTIKAVKDANPKQ